MLDNAYVQGVLVSTNVLCPNGTGTKAKIVTKIDFFKCTSKSTIFNRFPFRDTNILPSGGPIEGNPRPKSQLYLKIQKLFNHKTDFRSEGVIR